MELIVDPFREMANALRSRPGFNATNLKCPKGHWLAGAAATSTNNAELIARVDHAMFGWCLWVDKKPIDYHVGFVRDRYKPPRRSQLGHTDPAKWPKKGNDPWQMTFYLPLVDPNDDELYVFSTSSKGGRDALANLQEAYADNREFHPQDAHKLPLVTLSTDHYTHPEYGRVETPLFEIVRWVDPPANMKAVKPPASASPMLALEHTSQELPPDDEPGEYDNSENPDSENPGAGIDTGEIPF